MTEPASPLPLLQGERVLLRPPQPADVAERLALGHDPEFHRLVGGDPGRQHKPFAAADAHRWYEAVAARPLGWIIDVEGRLVGTARLHTLDLTNRRARYAVGILSARDRGKGYGTETTQLVLAHAFRQLGLHRVDLRVLEFNTRAISTYERCGFVKEGIERDSALIGGTWYSDVMMSVLEHEYFAA